MHWFLHIYRQFDIIIIHALHRHTHTHTKQQAYTHHHQHHHNHHHTVQVAMHVHVFMHISKWASWHTKDLQCKLQVMTTVSASEVFTILNDRKNTTSASCRWSRPPWALVGAGCSNQMRVAQEQVLARVCALVQAAICITV